jgi:uncharacterized glyoxalase superfamily protein PhnB
MESAGCQKNGVAQVTLLRAQPYYLRMIRNRSVPTDTVLAHVFYRDVAAALAWLTTTFGFTEHYRYGESSGSVSGAQIYLGDAWIMLSGGASPAQIGYRTQSLTVFVYDVDAHFDRTKSAGAEIVEDLHETCYGEGSMRPRISKATAGSSRSIFGT